jgi:hypothetical protein
MQVQSRFSNAIALGSILYNEEENVKKVNISGLPSESDGAILKLR